MENYQKEVPEKVKNFSKEVPVTTYQGHEAVSDDQRKLHHTCNKDNFELTIKRLYLEKSSTVRMNPYVVQNQPHRTNSQNLLYNKLIRQSKVWTNSKVKSNKMLDDLIILVLNSGKPLRINSSTSTKLLNLVSN